MSVGGRVRIVNVLGRDGNKSDKGFINTQALLPRYIWREHAKKIIRTGVGVVQHPLPMQLIKGWQKEGKERFLFAHLWAWFWAPQIPVYLMLNPCNVDYDLLKHIYMVISQEQIGADLFAKSALVCPGKQDISQWTASGSVWRSILDTSSWDGHECFRFNIWGWFGSVMIVWGELVSCDWLFILTITSEEAHFFEIAINFSCTSCIYSDLGT